jgi:hypothetical protein
MNEANAGSSARGVGDGAGCVRIAPTSWTAAARQGLPARFAAPVPCSAHAARTPIGVICAPSEGAAMGLHGEWRIADPDPKVHGVRQFQHIRFRSAKPFATITSMPALLPPVRALADACSAASAESWVGPSGQIAPDTALAGGAGQRALPERHGQILFDKDTS